MMDLTRRTESIVEEKVYDGLGYTALHGLETSPSEPVSEGELVGDALQSISCEMQSHFSVKRTLRRLR